MLPITLLPTSEPGTFLGSLNNVAAPDSQGAGASTLTAAFADILGNNRAPTPPATLLAGESLPGGGNPLPPLAATVDTELPADPGAIVASLEEQIAAIFPAVDAPVGDSVDTIASTDDELVDDLADTEVNEALVSPDEWAADGQVPAADLDLGARVADQAEVVAVPVQEKPLRTDPLAPPPPAATIVDTAIDPRVRRAEPPARPLVEAGPPGPAIIRDSVELAPPLPVTDRALRSAARQVRPDVTAAAGQPIRIAPDAPLPASGAAAPPAGSVDPAAPLVDGRLGIDQQVAVPAASRAALDVSVDSLHQPRLALAEAAASGSIRSPAAAAALPTIDVPVQDPAWDKAVSERVVMMAANRLQTADIRLTPAELGPLRVQVAMEDGATHVTFSAQHAVTRDALEQALPRLREMFADSGLQLGDARVDVENPDTREQQAERDGAAAAGQGEPVEAVTEADSSQSAPLRQQRGLVDTFV